MPKENYFANMIGSTQVMRSNGQKYTVRANRSRFFFPDEWMAFYDALKATQKPTFKFLVNTGARIEELRNVKVSDVDFERQCILLRITKGRNNDGSRKIRIIKVSSQFLKYIREVIRRYGLKKDDIFPILTCPGANMAMKNTLQRIEIVDWSMISVHNVRKTTETWLLSLGLDSLKIAKHFGHTVAMASKHYVGEDIFSYQEKMQIRHILGDLFQDQRSY